MDAVDQGAELADIVPVVRRAGKIIIEPVMAVQALHNIELRVGRAFKLNMRDLHVLDQIGEAGMTGVAAPIVGIQTVVVVGDIAR
jgi:hypothetical protein